MYQVSEGGHVLAYMGGDAIKGPYAGVEMVITDLLKLFTKKGRK